MKKNQKSVSLRNMRREAIVIGTDKLLKSHYIKTYVSKTYENTASYYERLFSGPVSQYNVTTLIDDRARYNKLKDKLIDLSKELDSGDELLISFTGHGARILKNSYEDLPQVNEYGWMLKDRIVFHMELWELMRNFRSGVKIIVLSDACYQGPVVASGVREKRRDNPFLSKNERLYKPIFEIKSRPKHHQVPASILIISASPEGGVATESLYNPFTVFAECFMVAWYRSLNDPKARLLRFYDDMLKASFDYRRTRMWVEANNGDVSKDSDSPDSLDVSYLNESLKPHITLRWHYYQGHKFTHLVKSKPFQ